MGTKTLKPASESLYDEDFAVWTSETARLLREKRFDEVDVEHIAGLPARTFPRECPFSAHQILDLTFLPE